MAVKSLETFNEDNQFFRSLVDMIPATAVFDEDLCRKIRGGESDEEDKSHPKKKKIKINPLKQKTVTQLQEELDRRSGQSFTQLKKKHKRKPKPGHQKDNDVKDFKSVAHSLEEIRAKLQARLSQLKRGRNTLSEEEAKEKKRLIMKDKKLKHKLKNKQKQNKHKGLQGGINSNTDDSPSQSESCISEKPVYNKEGKLVFSKFDFTDTVDSEKPKTDLKGKNYKRLLEKLEKRKRGINEVRQVSEESARKLEEKSVWKHALLKAGGEKLKDDEQLLRKAAKRQAKRKQKAKEAWESRTKVMKEDQKKREEKRKRNLNKRKEQKIDKKKKKAIKKGRLIPGF